MNERKCGCGAVLAGTPRERLCRELEKEAAELFEFARSLRFGLETELGLENGEAMDDILRAEGAIAHLRGLLGTDEIRRGKLPDESDEEGA